MAAAAPCSGASRAPATYSVELVAAPNSTGTPLVWLRDGSAEVAVAPERGGELASLSWRGVQLLDRALLFDEPPAGRWQGRGQVLFPAVGRQRDGVWAGPLDAAATPMPIHGFVQRARFHVAALGAGESSGATATLRLDAADLPASSRASYPFDWALSIVYTLKRGVLDVAHSVRRSGACATAGRMPFAVGNHITLRFPFTPDGSWSAGVLRGTPTHEHTLTPASLLSGAVLPRPELRSAAGMPLTHPLATNGVLGFGGEAHTGGGCELALVQPGLAAVRLTHTLLAPPDAVAAGGVDHRHFVLWGEPPPAGGEPGAPGFLCPEPWLSGPDSLNTLAGTPRLAPGQAATWTFTVAVENEGEGEGEGGQ
jgi:galactose mutarotase-like enzyme